MNRTFHYRVAWTDFACVFIIAAVAVYFLWDRSAANTVAGFCLLAVAVLVIERIIHTEYVLTSGGMLIVKRGRFARTLAVPVNEITAVRRCRAGLLPVSYVLVEYGAGHIISVRPFNEAAFVGEISKRQERLSES